MAKLDCTKAKARWLAAELRAHKEMVKHGESPRYHRAEKASEQAFMRAHRAGCRWTR